MYQIGRYLHALVVKNPSAKAGDVRDAGSIPRLGRFPGEGNGNPLQCSNLENPMDRGAWWATVPGVAVGHDWSVLAPVIFKAVVNLRSQDLLRSVVNTEKFLLCYAMLSHFSHGRFCVTPWTAAYQALPSMGFSRQEYQSGMPLPSSQRNFYRELSYGHNTLSLTGSGPWTTYSPVRLPSARTLMWASFWTQPSEDNLKISNSFPTKM